MTNNTTPPPEGPAQELKPCPFCGSTDIDPEGVASFKKEFRTKELTWNNATIENIEHRPACMNCSASTDGDWNTRAQLPRVADAGMRSVGDWIADWRFKYAYSGQHFDDSHKNFIEAIQQDAVASMQAELDRTKDAQLQAELRAKEIGTERDELLTKHGNLMMQVDRQQAVIRRLYDALNWLTHVVNGIGKSGHAPQPGEMEDANKEAQAALAEAEAMKGEDHGG